MAEYQAEEIYVEDLYVDTYRDPQDGSSHTLADLLSGGSGGTGAPDAVVGNGDSLEDEIAAVADLDSALIDIDPSYDPSVETYPITVDVPVILTGHGWGDNAAIDLGGEGAVSWLDVNIVANPKYPLILKDLRINDGAIGLDITEVENLYAENVLFDSQSDHGIDYEGAAFSGWGVYVNTIVDSAGNAGWQMGQATPAPNNTAMFGCQSRECGGPGVILGGHATDWFSGGIEQNDGVGLKFDTGSGGEYLVHGTYFESNALTEAGGIEDAHITVNTGTGLKHKVIDAIQIAPGGTQPDETVKVQGGENAIIRDMRGQGNASVLVTSGAADTRIYAGSEVAVTDNGTRTTINDVGSNTGDPGVGGDWNTNGYEGVMIKDTGTTNVYLFVNGAWVTL